MFQRKNASQGLPTTMSPLNLPNGDSGGYGGGYGGSTAGGFGFGNHGPDGSGKAIKMDSPIVKSWKQSSNFTKYSYYILAFCFFMIFMGYRYLRFGNASIWLTCHAQECTLELTPPGSRTKTLLFARHQLHSAQAIKTDKAGHFLSIDNSKFEPQPRGKKNKKYKSGAYKGPDENGQYKSYSLKFYAKTPEGVEKTEDDVDDGDFSFLDQYFVKETIDEGEDAGPNYLYVLNMRKFGLLQSRTRIRSMINKVESYIKRRRQKLLVKESVALPWQGLLLLIFGLLGVMLTLLIGQFWDEPPRMQGGPGIRRSRTGTTRKSGKNKPSFVVDTGRPSKYPPGYNYNKKY